MTEVKQKTRAALKTKSRQPPKAVAVFRKPTKPKISETKSAHHQAVVTSSEAKPIDKGGERIAKILARAGVASRRDVEKMILAGRVAVNGDVLTTPACVLSGGEYITVDGKPIAAAEATRLWRCHKPRNVMITHKDPEGRPTLFEILPKNLPRIVSVGRLDFSSEGLILLTNDGELARGLELPSKGWKRVYRARVYGNIPQDKLAALAGGIDIDGIKYGAIQAQLDSQRGDNAWLTVTLTEGKNREIRKIIEFLGGQVTRLIRVSYGPFQLGLLPPGGVDEIASKQIQGLGLSVK